MKRLVLMRHAKAEHYNAGGDHARELAPRGRSDAANAGLLLASPLRCLCCHVYDTAPHPHKYYMYISANMLLTLIVN